jgi:hypothetical protein
MAHGALIPQWLMAGLVAGKAVFRDCLDETAIKQHLLIAIGVLQDLLRAQKLQSPARPRCCGWTWGVVNYHQLGGEANIAYASHRNLGAVAIGGALG